ncbi:MAG: response regulator transcription factor [Angelakisella sp.]|nr:response regulator transcription factor [Angelakisella sp.]
MVSDTRLLIADTDAAVRGIIRISAQEEGWSFDEAGDGITALKLLRRNTFQIAILDYDLAELDGKIVCRQIRKSSGIPVIFLSSHGGETERLTGFAAGGNDYMIKPFYPRELVARIKSLLTLYGHAPEQKRTLVCGKISIDLLSHKAIVENRQLALTPKEYDLLLFFCQNPSKAYSRDALLNLVWGEDFYGSDRTVDTHIKSLRGKISPYHYYIVTIWGMGYKFET